MNPIDEAIAIKLFGWRWLAFDGFPNRDTSDFPKKCRVRRLFPAMEELGKSWKDYFKANNVGPATGDELLSYGYCYSNGPPIPPRFHDNETACFRALIPEMEKRGWRRFCLKFSKAPDFEVAFYKGGFCYRGKADTMAEAICQAALRALEGENNG